MAKIRLIRTIREYADVVTYEFDNPGVSFQAGQYGHLMVGWPWQGSAVRELSFASAPADAVLWFTVHTDTGRRYKRRLAALQPGQVARVFGVGGHAVLPAGPARPLVLIAGGVGMAPIRSLVLAARRRGGFDLRLVQVQRGEFLYGADLGPLVDRYEPVRPETFLDRVRVAAAATPEAVFYVCGTERLVTAVRGELGSLGVPAERMRVENFH